MRRTLALAAALSFAASTHAQAVRQMDVSSESMSPAFPKGSPVDVTVLNFKWIPTRGTPVVYLRANSGGGFSYYFHRILAVPGDQVTYDDESGSFSLNGRKLATDDGQPYETNTPEGKPATTRLQHEANGGVEYAVVAALAKYPLSVLAHERDEPPGVYPAILPHLCSVSETGFACKVPAGYVFVVGDNRAHTLLGFVPEEQIAGFVAQSPSAGKK